MTRVLLPSLEANNNNLPCTTVRRLDSGINIRLMSAFNGSLFRIFQSFSYAEYIHFEMLAMIKPIRPRHEHDSRPISSRLPTLSLHLSIIRSPHHHHTTPPASLSAKTRKTRKPPHPPTPSIQPNPTRRKSAPQCPKPPPPPPPPPNHRATSPSNNPHRSAKCSTKTASKSTTARPAASWVSTRPPTTLPQLSCLSPPYRTAPHRTP